MATRLDVLQSSQQPVRQPLLIPLADEETETEGKRLLFNQEGKTLTRPFGFKACDFPLILKHSAMSLPIKSPRFLSNRVGNASESRVRFKWETVGRPPSPRLSGQEPTLRAAVGTMERVAMGGHGRALSPGSALGAPHSTWAQPC